MQSLEPNGVWSTTFRALRVEDCRGPQLQDADDDHGTQAHRRRQRQLGEGQHVASWIWSAPGDQTGKGDDVCELNLLIVMTSLLT